MYGVTLNAWNTLSYADIPCVPVLKYLQVNRIHLRPQEKSVQSTKNIINLR